VSDSGFGMVDSTRLLVDLQQVDGIVKNFSGCLDPIEIARTVTDGLIEKFGCIFARIWLMEADGSALQLVASAGLSQRTNGFFGRVPIGAYKVGKIAQNQIPFLSNQLAAETWVGDRDWAIAHNIQGFAGYPLVLQGASIGVLAIFSQQPLLPEFLEVLQSLCTATTIGLAAALRYRQEKSAWPIVHDQPMPLSEQLAGILGNTQLTLMGRERSLSPPLQQLFRSVAEVLNQLPCIYSRLTYEADYLSLESVISGDLIGTTMATAFRAVQLDAFRLGSSLEIQPCSVGAAVGYGNRSTEMQRVLLSITFLPRLDLQVNLRCCSSILQMVFAHLIELAGLSVSPIADPAWPLLTDDLALSEAKGLIWIATDSLIPQNARGKIDLSINPQELRSAIETVMAGGYWGISDPSACQPSLGSSSTVTLSVREREIMELLAQGLRDREIANQLIVSESTVKFHMHNTILKLKAKTRFQALYQAMLQGLI
jgi:DNA-binding CsgD family transcriptional regulator